MIAVSHSERERDGAGWRAKLPLCVAFRARGLVGRKPPLCRVSSEGGGWMVSRFKREMGLVGGCRFF